MALVPGQTCAHCKATFTSTYNQAWRSKKQGLKIFCSSACRYANLGALFSTPVPERGPCLTCGKLFSSRQPKVYCTIACYVNSAQFREMSRSNRLKAIGSPEGRAKIAATLRTGEYRPCLECGTEIYSKRLTPKKFCTKVCYRSYLSKRFDRWVANPEVVALPQCYDEFLDREVLPCLVAGCEWTGKHLSLHVNQAHGIQAEDFKRAVGFNLGTGVISRPLAEALQGRGVVGVAAERMLILTHLIPGRVRNYSSLEGREHRAKARALADTGPTRICQGCGISFVQPSLFGRKLYHSTECRDDAYRRGRTGKPDKPGLSP